MVSILTRGRRALRRGDQSGSSKYGEMMDDGSDSEWTQAPLSTGLSSPGGFGFNNKDGESRPRSLLLSPDHMESQQASSRQFQQQDDHLASSPGQQLPPSPMQRSASARWRKAWTGLRPTRSARTAVKMDDDDEEEEDEYAYEYEEQKQAPAMPRHAPSNVSSRSLPVLSSQYQYNDNNQFYGSDRDQNASSSSRSAHSRPSQYPNHLFQQSHQFPASYQSASMPTNSKQYSPNGEYAMSSWQNPEPMADDYNDGLGGRSESRRRILSWGFKRSSGKKKPIPGEDGLEPVAGITHFTFKF